MNTNDILVFHRMLRLGKPAKSRDIAMGLAHHRGPIYGMQPLGVPTVKASLAVLARAYDATALAENAANALEIYGKGVSIPEGVFELSRRQTDTWERERSRRLNGVSETMALHQRGDFRRSHHLLGRGGR